MASSLHQWLPKPRSGTKMKAEMSGELTLADVAGRTGEAIEHLELWRAHGLIGSHDRKGLTPSDLARVRFVRSLLDRGIALEKIREANDRDGLLAVHLDSMFPQGVGQIYSYEQVAQIVGWDRDTLRRFCQAAGLGEQGDVLYEEDLRALEAFKAAGIAGFPEEALLQLARVYADGLGRVAEAESRLYHFYVHERIRATGLRGRALMEADVASSERLIPMIEPALLYFHQKGRQRASMEDALFHLRDEETEDRRDVAGRLRMAVMFVDLSSFTQLTDAMGDEAAAHVVARFSELVRDCVIQTGGRVVKQIGDAFMLVFSQSRAAVACALEIERRAGRESLFPAVRSGIHYGDVLYREGDYLGTTINVAARLAAHAKRHEILVTDAVRNEVGDALDLELTSCGRHRLKGLADELELFVIAERRAALEQEGSVVDPVCGMELRSGDVVATLSLHGHDRAFCSRECLQRFVATPERYEQAALRR